MASEFSYYAVLFFWYIITEISFIFTKYPWWFQTMVCFFFFILRYVFWNIHNPKREEYVWTGLANLEQFLQVAQDVGLLVLLRAGPYVCGEWEFVSVLV